MSKRVGTFPMGLDEESRRAQIEDRMRMLSQLTPENVLSLLDFTLMICGNEMPDVFVTTYDLLHDNKDHIEANIGIKIMTLEEASIYAEEEARGASSDKN